MRSDHIEGLKGSWEWLEYASQLPARPMAISGSPPNGLVMSGRCILAGASVINNGTASGGLNLLDGVDAKGLQVATIPLAVGAAFTDSFAVNGVLMELGVFVSGATAGVQGTIYIIPLWHHRLTPPGE